MPWTAAAESGPPERHSDVGATANVAVISVSEILSALSFALDLTEGQPMGHSVRTCILGMRIAEELGLPLDLRADLYYALLLKDSGCSSNASRMFQILGTDELRAKRDVKTTDWSKLGWESLRYAIAHVRTGAPFLKRMRALTEVALQRKRNARELVRIRCERGAEIARRIGLREGSASAIYSLDELWNGEGQPEGLREREIPLLSRIMNLAQTIEVFFRVYGAEAAIEVAGKRKGRWFDPEVVRAFHSIARRKQLWEEVEQAAPGALALEPQQMHFAAHDATLDNICLAFADVIDAKSPFTYRHSTGVASAAVSIARTLGLTETEVKLIRRAALLHDIGKLGISNEILEKADPLTGKEWEIVHKHPYFSAVILNRVPGFGRLSETVACHHERLNGSGYFRHLTAEQLPMPARILAVSEVFDAMLTDRPYRGALPLDDALKVLRRESPGGLDADCVAALSCAHDASAAGPYSHGETNGDPTVPSQQGVEVTLLT